MISRARVLAALTAAATAPALAGRASADDATIKIAAVPFDSTAQPYYCQELGIFKKVGLDAELDSFTTSGAVIASSVAGGTMDIGVSNLVSLAQAHVKGLPFVIIASAALYSYKAPADALMVPLNSAVKTAKDLNGKTIASNGLKNITEFAPRAWIDRNGGDSSTVKFVEIAPPAQAGAMAEGRVDAACVTEPYIEPTKKVARVLSNCFDAIAPVFVISGFFTTRDWAKSHADDVRKFQQAMRESALWANAHPDQSAAILAQAAKVDVNVLRHMYRAVYTDRLDPAQMQPVIDVTAKYAGIPSFPAEELVYR